MGRSPNQQIEDLEKENATLRAALEKILSSKVTYPIVKHFQRIAHEALSLGDLPVKEAGNE